MTLHPETLDSITLQGHFVSPDKTEWQFYRCGCWWCMAMTVAYWSRRRNETENL